MTSATNPQVLIICFDNLGDVVFASTLAAAIVKAHPRAAIDVWTKSYSAGVAARYPNLRQVFASDPYWDRSPGQRKGSLFNFIRTWWSIRKAHRYDAILVASPNWRGALWSYGLRAPVRSGFATKKSRWFLTHRVPWYNDEPICNTLGTLLAPLNVVACSHYELRADQPPVAHRDVIIVHGFAGDRRRCLQADHLLTLLQHLSKTKQQSWHLYLMGTPLEIASIDNILRQCPHVEAVPPTILSELAHRTALFVGHDSGPLHIANAQGIAVFGIYLPGTPPRTLPSGTARHQVYHRQSPDAVNIEELCTLVVKFMTA